MRRRLVAALATFVMLATACGSTVPVEGTAGTGTAPGTLAEGSDGLGGPMGGAAALDDGMGAPIAQETGPAVSADPARGATVGAQAGSAASGSAAGPAGDGPGAGGPGATGGTGGGGREQASGSVAGTTDKTIKLGVFTVEPGTGESGAESIGAGAYSPGDTRAYWRAVVGERNRRGGIAGRKIELVFAYIPLVPTDTRNRIQAACTKFTQDDRVFAVVSDVVYDEPFVACLSKAGIPVVYAQAGPDDDLLARYPGTIITAAPSLHRLTRNYVDGLVATKFFRERTTAGQRPRIGLIRVDDPRFQRVSDGVLKPALARHGLRVDEEQVVEPVTNDGALSQMASQMNGAVLRFRSANISHVLWLTINATEPLVFMRSAESQQYRPLYGLSTQQAPAVLETVAPREQLAGARGIGWAPMVDVSDSTDPGPTRGAPRCDRVMREAGAPVAQRSERATAHQICDTSGLFFEAAAAAGRHLTAQGFLTAVERLGARGHTPVLTFSAKFGPGRHDGAAVRRPFRFLDDCDCFGYAGRPTALK